MALLNSYQVLSLRIYRSATTQLKDWHSVVNYINIHWKRIWISILCKITFDFIYALLCLSNLHTLHNKGACCFYYFSVFMYVYVATLIKEYFRMIIGEQFSVATTQKLMTRGKTTLILQVVICFCVSYMFQNISMQNKALNL